MAKRRLRPSQVPGIQWVHRDSGWRCRGRVLVGLTKRQITGKWRRDLADAIRDRDWLSQRRDHPPSELVRLSDAMQATLAKCASKDRRDATRLFYKNRFKRFANDFPADPPLHELDAAVIEAWSRERVRRDGVSWATVRADLRALNRCFTVTGTTSPVRTAVANLPDAEAPEVDWFATGELREVLQLMRGAARDHAERDADIVEFLACTGLRLAEATRLEVRDASLQKGIVVVRIGKRGRRQFPIQSDEVRHLVTQFLDGRGRFEARSNDPLLPLGYDAIKSMLRRWSNRLAEPRLHAHALRHTFGTSLARAGATNRQIQAAMGLRTPLMTERYVHLSGMDVAATVASISFRSA